MSFKDSIKAMEEAGRRRAAAQRAGCQRDAFPFDDDARCTCPKEDA